MADVSNTGLDPRGQPKYSIIESYSDIISTGLWVTLFVSTAILISFLFIVVSPAITATMYEYVNMTYYRAESAYLTAPILFMIFLSGMGLAANMDRLRMLIGFFLSSICFITILIILILDSNTDFTSETSKITIFTAIALLLCGIVSALNYVSWTYSDRRSASLNRIFWTLLTFAFIFAALDESLMIHERLGRVVSMMLGRGSEDESISIQDEITVTYALSALVIIGVMGVLLRSSQSNKHHILVFIGGSLVYIASVVLDTSDRNLHTPPLSLINLQHMANTIEEILEFVASVIFLFACILAFLNARQNARLTSAIEESISRWRGRMLLYPLAAAAAALLVVAVAVVLLSPPRGLGFKGTRDLAVEAFTGDESARLHPDGLTSSHGRLYVANDAPPSIAVLDRRSGHSTVIDAIHPAGTPESVAVASDGRIYFSDDSGGSIYVVYGRQVRRLLGRESGLRAPKGLLIGPGDELYIADTGASAIFKYSGGKLTFYASSLDGIAAPHELAFDSHGNLYVTEDQRRILKVRPDGRASVFLGESPGFTPEAIAIRDDRIYVTDSSAGAVLEYGLDGVGRALIVFPATLGRKLEGVAVTGNGDLWVGVRPDKGIPGAILRIHKRAS